uniref:ArnT family glycosyltransferase n=1 Tax=Algoriphagus sp. TaxID=1872435 RepID=UPI004047E84E
MYHHKYSLSFLLKSLTLVISLFLFIIFVNVIYSHKVFGEWDAVMHYFSGKYFLQKGLYSGWASFYWPPLQPIILSFGDPFIIGKIVSAISGFLSLLVVYYISIFFLKEIHLSFLVVLYVFSCSLFLEVFTFVENHSLETLFFLSTILFFLRGNTKNTVINFIICGLFCGLACISRYTSYSLALSIIIINIFSGSKNFINNLYFLLGFFIINAPWWLMNYQINGSPLHTMQFTNVGSAIYPGENSWEFEWVHQDKFEGMVDLILNYPLEFASNIVKNFNKAIVLVVMNSSSFKIISTVISIFLARQLFKKDKREKLFNHFLNVFIVILFFILLCSTAFIFTEALAPVIFLFIVFLLIYFLNNVKYSSFILIFIISINCFGNYKTSKDIIASERNDAQLSDLQKVNFILNKVKKKDDVLMSIHPANSYYTKMNWVMYPLIKNINLCDAVDYKLSDKIIKWSPKYPVDLIDYSVDYIIVTRDLFTYGGNINLDLKINTENCKKYNFILLYQSNNVTLYKIIR